MATIQSLGARFPQIIETGILANLASGAVIGILGRLAMTALTLAGGFSNEFSPLKFTVPGILTIVTLPMIVGIPIAILLVIFWRFIPGSGRVKALYAGGITFVFPGLLLLLDSSFKLNGANRFVGLPLFALLYFGYGFLTGTMIDTIGKRSVAFAGIHPWVRRAILFSVLVTLWFVYRWADAIAFNR